MSELAWTRRALYVVAVAMASAVCGGGLGGCTGTREARLPECKGAPVPINAAAHVVAVPAAAAAARPEPEVAARAH
jgi:hypothetical protein